MIEDLTLLIENNTLSFRIGTIIYVKKNIIEVLILRIHTCMNI